MTSLALVFGCFLAAALVLESRLLLNNVVERVAMIFSLAAGLLVLSVQVLSLAICLNGPGMILAGAASLGVAFCFSLIWRRPVNRVSWQELIKSTRAGLASAKDGRFALSLLLAAMGLIALNAVAGAFMIPLGDPYHAEMPLFWIQNQSIAPFFTYDPRITCTSFVGEVLGFPGYLFCHGGGASLVAVWVAGCLSLGVVFSLARSLGCSPRASAITAALLLGIHGWQQYFFEADAAMCLSGLWVGASVLFLMKCADAGELSREALTRLGCSACCFILGCGAKNTTIFLAPFILLALAVVLRRRLLAAKVLGILALWGLVALLCSGVPWNYAWNYRGYGNFSGPLALQGHLSSERSASSVWTRCCRGAVLLAFDVPWLPHSAYKSYQTCCQKTVRLMGGKNVLAEDEPNLFNFQSLKPGAGIGLIGPLIVLPAFIYGAMLGWRQKSLAGPATRRRGLQNFWLLLLLVSGYAFLCHVFLRWQDIGLWRLMPADIVLAVPVCGLLLEKRLGQIMALSVACLTLVFSWAGNLSMISNRFDLEHNRIVQQIFQKLGKQPRITVECQWENGPPQTAILHEPYNNREITLMFLERARHPAVIVLVGEFCSDAYYFFGPDLSNRIIPLEVASLPEHFLESAGHADYMVFDQCLNLDPAEQTLWAGQHGFRPFLRVNQQGRCLFLSFQKIPATSQSQALSSESANKVVEF